MLCGFGEVGKEGEKTKGFVRRLTEVEISVILKCCAG